MKHEPEVRPETADILARAKALLPRSSADRPLIVLQVGVVLALRSHPPSPAGWRRRMLDRLLRRLPLPGAWLCDLASARIVRVLADQSFRLTIVDDSPRALRVAQQTAGSDAADIIRADIGMADPVALRPLRGAFDIVIAAGEPLRRSDGERAARMARNLAALARPDGLVVERHDLLSAAPEMTLADFPSIYRKKP